MEHILSLLDSLDAVIYVSDVKTYEILYINEYGRKVFGGGTGQLCYKLLQKDQNEPCPFCTNHLLLDPAGNPTETYVWEFKNTRNGVWYQCRDSIIKWSDGRLARLEIATDISSRKKTEFQILQLGNLKERIIGNRPLQEKLKDITESSLTIFDIDLAGIWLFKSPNKNRIRKDPDILDNSESDDKTRVELSLYTYSEKGNPRYNIPALIPFFNELERNLKNDIYDNSNRDKFAENMHLYMIDWAESQGLHSSLAFPLIDEGSREIGYMFFFRNGRITEDQNQLMQNLVHTSSQVIISAKTYETLSRMKEHYRKLVENLPLGIFLKDNASRYVSCNRNMEQDFGISQEDIIGKSDSDLFPSDIAGNLSNLDEEITKSKITKKTVLEFIQNNHTRWIESVRTPLFDQDGTFTGILGIMHDITDLKLAQDELKCLYNELELRVEARTEELFKTKEAYHKANSKLNLLNSITRHDILNQITALYGYLLFARESVTDPAIQGYLEKTEQSAKMIHDQIQFTKLYQDIGVHAPVWQKVQKVAEKAVFGLKSDGITISVSLKNVIVYADPLLEKVFYTLVENSIRHGERVTSIKIENTVRDGNLIIWYEDDGAGIESDSKERIFIRGFGSNTGLGLFLVKEILNITGLTISETGTPGKGVRFEVLIPKEAYDLSHQEE